MVVVLARNSF